jgi:hypothetical protein
VIGSFRVFKVLPYRERSSFKAWRLHPNEIKGDPVIFAYLREAS